MSLKSTQHSKRLLDSRAGMVHSIASYIDIARRQPPSQAARLAATRCILDLLGAVAAGLNDTAAVAVRRMALSTMGSGDVPVWLTGRTSSVIGAAWANSSAASALDLDDGHRLARGHPGAAVIPTALAIAQEVGATADKTINAIIIGYEVGVTIGSARKVYGNTGTWSSYAAVATAAALRGTPPAIIEHALSIAGESAPNQLFASAPAQVPPPEGSDVKEGIPWSVVTGLIALGLAEAGHTGPRNILDSATHYAFPEGLGLRGATHILNTYFKLYACCRHVHAPLDALLGLLDRERIDPCAIDAIRVDTYSGALRISNKHTPENIIDIQYSIPYCLALAALAGSDMLLPLTHDALGRDEVSDLARRVELSLNPALDAKFPKETLARVTVDCGGQRFVSEVTTPRGEATTPLSYAELEAKFAKISAVTIDAKDRTRLFEAVRALPIAGDVRELMKCLQVPAKQVAG